MNTLAVEKKENRTDKGCESVKYWHMYHVYGFLLWVSLLIIPAQAIQFSIVDPDSSSSFTTTIGHPSSNSQTVLSYVQEQPSSSLSLEAIMESVDKFRTSMRGPQFNHRSHYYASEAPSPSHFLKNPKACRRWSQAEYLYAIAQIGTLVHHNEYNECLDPSSGYLPLVNTGDCTLYLSKEDRRKLANKWWLYDCPTFVNIVRCFPEYDESVVSLCKRRHLLADLSKEARHVIWHEARAAERRIELRAREKRVKDEALRAAAQEEAERKKEIEKEKLQKEAAKKEVAQVQLPYDLYAASCSSVSSPEIIVPVPVEQVPFETYHTKNVSQESIDRVRHDSTQLSALYADSLASLPAHMAHREHAIIDIYENGNHYRTCTYTVEDTAYTVLHKYEFDTEPYMVCNGNQLQQVLHGECVELVHTASDLIVTNSVYRYQESVLECIDAARAYNQDGNIVSASRIADFCWMFLEGAATVVDWGVAAVEGTCAGITAAVTHMATHPIETAVCAAGGGQYILAYQLACMCLDVAGIAVTCAIDPEQGLRKWDDYITPLTDVINTITNKQVTVRDAIKTGTAFAAGFVAQGKILSGLNKLYTITKSNALQWAATYSPATPAQYMATPEGQVFKVAHMAQSNKPKNGIDANKSHMPFPEGTERHAIGELSPLKLGSTGRNIPSNLVEQMALEEAIANAKNGEFLRLSNGMTDPRWHKIEGWYKMFWDNESTGRKIQLHYVGKWIDNVLHAIDDFKFHDPK